MSEKETFWLGIDCGGTYLKAGLYNSQGKEFAIERQSVHTLSPQPGWAERDMRLWQHCAATISRLLQRTGIGGEQVKGVGISAQGKGLFLLDKKDQPLGTAILSSDRRAMEIVSAGSRTAFRKSSTR
jgi:L-xylulokinase